MRDDAQYGFDPHEEIHADDPAQVARVSLSLGVAPEDVRKAIEEVGSHATAVAIYLGRPEVLGCVPSAAR